MAAAFGLEVDAISHNVGRGSAVNHADVARSGFLSLHDQAVPAVGLQVGDGGSGDCDRADAVLRIDAGVAGQAVDGDVEIERPGGADGDEGRVAAVPVEA